MTSRWKTYYNSWKKYLRWIGWGMSAAALAYLVYKLYTYPDYRQLNLYLHTAGTTGWYCLTAAVLLIPVQLLAEARRWQWTLHGWKKISLHTSWQHVLTGLIAGFITPYRAGDIPARLLAAGIDSTHNENENDNHNDNDNWHTWLHDWKKWIPVLLWTGIRYLIWGLQLWAVMTFVHIHLSPLQALSSIALYYLVISIMPGLPAADVALKGGWAVIIFEQYTDNIPAIAIAVSIIWLINTILPVLFASIKKFL